MVLGREVFVQEVFGNNNPFVLFDTNRLRLKEIFAFSPLTLLRHVKVVSRDVHNKGMTTQNSD